MFETSFPVSDLLRRKTQTSLVVACLTLSVASTLFLLLFTSRLGVGVTSVSQNVLTVGLSQIFAQFIRFVGILIFVVGAVLSSFVVFLMMTQRTRDFGLIKAAGCPNDLLFGYYMTELLLVTALSCFIGVVFGLAADYGLFSLSGLAAYQGSPNLWFIPLVFVVFFVLALIFGARPLLNATKLPPTNTLSTAQYYGLTATSRAKPFTKSRLTLKVALRSLFRRKTATVRIVLLLSTVFVLLTVSVAGSLIAEQTTTSWVRRASGENVVAVAHKTMALQYETLESAFLGAEQNVGFNYTDPQLGISNEVLQQLASATGVTEVDARLVIMERVHEISNFTIDPDTQATIPVGDSREGDVLVVGVDPNKVTSAWFTQGRFLNGEDDSSIVVGDAVAEQMFSQPLAQSMRIQNQQLSIVGVCVDPINNGKVAYAPLEKLQNMTGLLANVVLVQLDPSFSRSNVINEINQAVSGSDSIVFDLDVTIEKNVDFLGSTWSSIMLLPVFTLSSAALCLVAYVALAVDEQRQEFGFLRAMGAKPRTVTNIVAIQSLVVLLSSVGFGLSLGTVATLLILMRQPLVTGFTIAEIAAWLLITLAAMFLLSLVPELKLARALILKIIA